METLAAGASIAKILIVTIAVAAFVGYVVWKVYAVAKAARAKGTPDEKQKGVGKAVFGGGEAYGKGHDVGKQAGEKLVAWIKGKRKK